MNEKDEILKIINQGYDSLPQAIDLLYKMCPKEDKKSLETLEEEYINPSLGHNEVRFIKQIEAFAFKCFRGQENFKNVVNNDFYSALCELDYKPQTIYFETIYKHKKIAVFLLHGTSKEHEKDLRWLSKQILSKIFYKEEEQPRYTSIDCESKARVISTFNDLMEELIIEFGVVKDDTNNPINLFRDNIQEKLKPSHYVCVIKNAGNFLRNQGEIDLLFEKLLKVLNEQVSRVGHNNSFILFFLDNTTSEYKASATDHFFWFSNVQKKLFSKNAVDCKDVKIFDLSPIGKVKEKQISEWVTNQSIKFPAVYKKTVGLRGNEKSLIEQGNNPFQVIQSICNALEINIDQKWIE